MAIHLLKICCILITSQNNIIYLQFNYNPDNMKTIQLYFLLFAISICGIISSCSDDDNNSYAPITLSYPEESIEFDNESRYITLSPFSEGILLHIKGGDENYTVTNADNKVVTAAQTGNKISITPLSIGSSAITIKDNAGNSYVLSVNIEFYKHTYDIVTNEVLVEGGDLTMNEKKAIEEELLKLIPVKPKGKYVFIRSNKDNNIGDIEVYPNTGGKTLKGTYKYSGNETRTFTINIGDNTHIYEYLMYNGSLLRNEVLVPMMFREDLTEKFKEKYPAVEKAYAIQGMIQER